MQIILKLIASLATTSSLDIKPNEKQICTQCNATVLLISILFIVISSL